MRMRRHLAVAVAILVVALYPSGPAAASSTMDTSGTGGATTRIGVVRAGSESDADAIVAGAARDPGYRRAALALTAAWAVRIRAGERLSLGTITDGVDRSVALARLTDLTGRLTGAAAAPAVNGNNPNSFAVRGAPGPGRTYWTGMALAVAFHYCDVGGCEPDTDRFTCTTTVNPGARTSSVSWNCRYFPSSGQFANKHLELWTINRGVIGGITNTGDVSAPNSATVSDGRPLNGDVLTVAATLWVWVAYYQGYVPDGAKTADATCRAAPDNVCVY